MSIETKKVCDELIERLQGLHPAASKKPPTPVPASAPMRQFDTGTPVSSGVVLTVEEQLKVLNEEFEAFKNKILLKDMSSDATPVESEDTDKKACVAIALELQKIVSDFNASLQEWYKKYGCVVNFSWGYSGFKKLEISAIDYIVYRKEAPSEKTLKEVLERAPKMDLGVKEPVVEEEKMEDSVVNEGDKV